MTTTNDSPDVDRVDNGVNVDALLGARAALTDAREAAIFTFKVTNEWVDGTYSRSTIDDFNGLGADHRHRQPYTLESDHPEVFASADNGPTPTEMILAGLAGCLTAGVASVAQHRGLQLRSVRSTVTGIVDIAGILGIDPDVRNGFRQIEVAYEIDADATHDELEALVAQSQKRSAVFDVVTNPTPVVVTVA